MRQKTFIPEPELRMMYVDNMMTTSDIGAEYGVTYHTIISRLKEYDIPIRSHSESLLIGKNLPDEKNMRYMYLDKGMSPYAIAKEIGISRSAIITLLKKYNIQTRSLSESMLNGKTLPDEKELRCMYIDNNMSRTEICNEFGVSISTVTSRLIKYNISIRSLSNEKKGRHVGENNPNWKGGITSIPYCKKFNNTFKEAVRERDDYTCQLCGFEQKLNGTRLSIHHIHYLKEDCYPDVVALCRSCNSRVNGDRDYWEERFENELIARGLLYWSLSNA